MPEGHTIHRIARDHTQWFAGQTVTVESPQGRFSAEAARLTGRKLAAVEAHGKHLFYRFGRDHVVHVHLGLYGKFRNYKSPLPLPRGAVRIRLMASERGFDLNGPNQCELLSVKESKELRLRLGQDPLRPDADPELLWSRISRSRRSIGSLLLDQAFIAGVGNIYRAEILYLLGIDPTREGKQLAKSEFDELWSTTKRLLEIGVKYNRIITVSRDSTNKPLSRLSRVESLHVYKKNSCQRCRSRISISDLGGRKLYYCGNCQK